MTGRLSRFRNWHGKAKGVVVVLAAAATALLFAAVPTPERARAQGAKAPDASQYLGNDACKKCHRAQYRQHLADVHSKNTSPTTPAHLKGCEGCHGPGKAHKEAVDLDEEDLKMKRLKEVPAAELTKLCLTCHSTLTSAVRFHSNTHAAEGLACRNCHQIHQPKATDKKLKQAPNDLCLSCHAQQRAEFKANAHHPLFEGRVDCVDCHDPHGGEDPGMAKASIEKLCSSCHLDKRGPFVFEHGPNVDPMEDACLTCHKPHGSPAKKLTKFAGRGLCVQCHTDIVTDGTHRTRPGTCWQAGCHVRIHGSQTHPQFLQF